MRRLFSSKTVISVLVMCTLIAAFAGGVALRNASSTHAATPKASSAKNPFCSRLGKSISGSSGAWTYCFGSQAGKSSNQKSTSGSFVGPNVNAASPQEDITPNGTQVYGQSETSIAGNATYVIEAWNDSTGLFAPCPTPMFKEELTGFGFSANGGKSFKDQGGLPNDCTTGFKLFGDPSVEMWQPGGAGHPAYFYISSLYNNSVTGQSDLALNTCKAMGTGSSATLTCSMPTILATGGPKDFLDKEFLSIDPARARLYASYDRFGAINTPTANGQVELAVCDLSKPATPVCYPGASPAPYLVVQPAQACENEGAYPAVDIKSGAVYVAWEYNWATNYLGPAPCNTTVHVQNRLAYVPFACLTLTPTSPCMTAPKQVSVNINSIDLAFIPGYNRNPAGAAPASDFPRIAVSDKFGTVSIVWNDTRFHPMGDILLQSYHLVSLSAVQSSPARVNPDSNGGLHFMPAIRNVDDGGHLSVSYFQRNSPNTAVTNVDAVLDLKPTATGPASSFVMVTTKPTDWNNVSSDIVPNFGDYTDNYFLAKSQAPYTNDVLYVAWSDGQLGLPQPFEAHGMS